MFVLYIINKLLFWMGNYIGGQYNIKVINLITKSPNSKNDSERNSAYFKINK